MREMHDKHGEIYDDVSKCVDEVIEYVGKDIVFAMTLALGKPVLFINELYRRAREDPTINLTILTALPLEKPRGQSDIEKRFLKPISDRVFDGVPEFEYMLDHCAGKLPPNVKHHEAFSKAGRYLNDEYAQMNHFSSNYTHIVRDAFARGVNVFGQLISCKEFDGKMMYSMGCNTDICIGSLKKINEFRDNGKKVAIIGEANPNLPFMYGDAVVAADEYDIILQGPKFEYRLFGPPKDAVAVADHMIGINVSTLIKDGGTIQVGIGALGDAIVAGLVMRNDQNKVYQEFIEKAELPKRYGKLIKEWGDTCPFHKGLYGSSEMFVDAFMQMYKNNILKRPVFESVPIMKLINRGTLSPDSIPPDIIDQLIEIQGIHTCFNDWDFNFLTEFGILKAGLTFENGIIQDGGRNYSADMSDEKNRLAIRELLGQRILNGRVILGAFFVGPQAFYDALNEMSEEERKKFGMSGVEKVNQLYGGEELRRLQRINGRFVNTGVTATLLGSIASDQLADGRVISGIGGQYNFVAMAHALEDGRLIMMVKSTKGFGKTLKSNIVFSYGHCSIPRHLRDIIVTEYGIADICGKTDSECVAAMLNICDSRFQEQILDQAKKAGKINKDYEIPAEYRNNYPEKLAALVKPYQSQGYFKPYPFGTDLNDDDIALGGSLKVLKALGTGAPLKMATGVAAEMLKPIPPGAQRHLERMELAKPNSLKERLMQKMVVFALRNNNRL